MEYKPSKKLENMMTNYEKITQNACEILSTDHINSAKDLSYSTGFIFQQVAKQLGLIFLPLDKKSRHELMDCLKHLIDEMFAEIEQKRTADLH